MMEKTFKIEKVSNGYIITTDNRKILARSTIEIGRIIANFLDKIEPMEIKNNGKIRP
jgi:hypothetical protein